MQSKAAIVFAVFIAVFSMSFPRPGMAQETRATVSGQIKDQSGGVIPGATVTITSVERNISSSAISNEAGLYVIGFLLPGKYKLTVEASGFKKYVRENIQLGVAEKTGIDAVLEVGALADTVMVSEQTSLLQTESANNGQIVSTKLLVDIPNNGRNFMQLAWALPGVIKTGRYWGSMELYATGNTGGAAISGGRGGENEFLIDGVAGVRPGRSVSHIPSLDSLQEFKVQTNAYDSQYGRFGGGVISLSTRAGTNAFHGSAYEHLKNDKLNANDWAANRGGEPRSPFRNNTFGFALGGPIWLPKVLDLRNRVFFLLSYEGLREVSSDTAQTTIPLAEQLRGDFSGLLNSSGQLVKIYDPLTTTSAGVRTAFADNKIPVSRINSIAQKAASFYPPPRTAGDGPSHLNNYIFPTPNINGYNQWIGRLDVVLNNTNRVFFRYGETPYEETRGIQWGNNAAEPTGNSPLLRNGRNWVLDWASTINPTTTFNFRSGLTRWEAFSGNLYGKGYDPKQLGFPASLVGQFTYFQFPRFNLGIYSPLGSSSTASTEVDDSYSFQPNLNKVWGRHVLKTGLEFRIYNLNRSGPGLASGNYTFSKGFTQADPFRADSVSGNEFASFLLGYSASGSVDRNIDPAYSYRYWAAYLQDDWKFSSRLTFNLGLRWDYEQPAAERFNRMIRGFAFDQPSPIASKVTGLSLKGGLLYAGTEGEARLAFVPKRAQIQPRAGASYRLTEKTVLRGGWGLFFLGQSSVGPSTGFSRRTDLVSTKDGGLTPNVTLSDPFPDGLLKPVGNSLGLSTNLGQAVSFQYLDRKLPYSIQYSIGIQREIWNSWVVDVSYVGNLTRRLPIGAGLNFLPASELGRASSYYTERIANPMAGLLPDNAAKNGTTIPRQDLLFAYPQYTSVTISDIPIGRQRYDSMQLSARKRFSRGISLFAAYTISKTLEQVNLLNAQDYNLQDPLKTRMEKRLMEWDVPQKLAILSTAEIPFGRGRKFGNNMNSVLNQFLGGWQTNWQVTYQSGYPFDYPNAAPTKTGNFSLPKSQRTLEHWFDTSFFPKQSQPAFTLRNFPTRTADVRLAPLENWDISVFKDFDIREGIRFQFRTEFLNAFNHPWFSRIDTNSVTSSSFGSVRLDAQNQLRLIVFVGRLTF